MSDDVTIRDNKDDGRIEAWVGEELAGFTEYQDADGVRTMPHTQVDEKFQGRGLAAKVIARGLDDAQAQGLTVHPVCPAVQRYIKKNSQYLDLVPQDRRAEFGVA